MASERRPRENRGEARPHGDSEWLWPLVDHSDDERRLVFDKLDNEQQGQPRGKTKAPSFSMSSALVRIWEWFCYSLLVCISGCGLSPEEQQLIDEVHKAIRKFYKQL
jgi:hypothetical protein